MPSLRKEKVKKRIILLVLLVLFGCTGGGDNAPLSSYVGFTTADFRGKTLYAVQSQGTEAALTKYEFQDNGLLVVTEATRSQDGHPYFTGYDIHTPRNGGWAVIDGKLLLDGHTVTLLQDDTEKCLFRIDHDGTELLLFYDQDRGWADAEDQAIQNVSNMYRHPYGSLVTDLLWANHTGVFPES